MYKDELAFKYLRESELQKVLERTEKFDVVRGWLETMDLRIKDFEANKWGGIWTVDDDQIADFENALIPDLVKMTKKDQLKRRKARIWMIDGITEMKYHVNSIRAFSVLEGPVALYSQVMSRPTIVTLPEEYKTGDSWYIFNTERYGMLPLSDGKHGYGLPKTIVLAEIVLTRNEVEYSASDEMITIDPYENIKR